MPRLADYHRRFGFSPTPEHVYALDSKSTRSARDHSMSANEVIRTATHRYRELAPLARLIDEVEGSDAVAGYAFGRV